LPCPINQFFLLEADDLQLDELDTADDNLLYTAGRDSLFQALMEDFSAIPRISNDSDYDNYAIINVSPSVVPNPYLPAFRVYVFNITHTDEVKAKKKGKKRKHKHPSGPHGDKERRCREAPYEDTWKCRLNQPWHSDGSAPSRRNELWTPVGYAQVRKYQGRSHGSDCEIVLCSTSGGRQRDKRAWI
jgi:endopolyphosphatase